MIQTHTVNLYTSQFNKFKASDQFIIEDAGYNVGDYVLFKEVETTGEETKETGLHRMTNISEVITDEGLKEGYVILVLKKL